MVSVVRTKGKEGSLFCHCSSDYTEGFAELKTVPDSTSVDEGRFKKPTDDTTLQLLSTKTFAQNTEKKMVWAVTLYREWWYRRCSQQFCPPQIVWANIEKPESLMLANLQVALCSFVCEVRRKDEREFPGETLKQIVIMIQLYLEKQGVYFKLIDDPKMARFRNTLDNLMKKRAAEGISHKESSLAIDMEDKDTLWEKDVLGNSDPDQLRDTLFFLLGINFALRGGGEEHKNLRAPGFNPQLTVSKDRGGERYLKYKEDMKGKTHQGGLSSKVKPRTLKVYGSNDPSRNVVNLFIQYTRLLPKNRKNPCLYKYALSASRRSCSQWYSNRPVRINQLKKVVKSLMSHGGLEGRYTNHSLRATCATRMFQAGIDEQLIKTFTGHKSDSVRDYKRVNDSLLRHANNAVSSTGKPSCTVSRAEDLPSLESPAKKVKVDENSDPCATQTDDLQFVSEVMSSKPTKAHCKPCPIRDENGQCTNLCSVLKKIDKKVDSKAKKVKFLLKIESE